MYAFILSLQIYKPRPKLIFQFEILWSLCFKLFEFLFPDVFMVLCFQESPVFLGILQTIAN